MSSMEPVRKNSEYIRKLATMRSGAPGNHVQVYKPTILSRPGGLKLVNGNRGAAGYTKGRGRPS